MQPDQENKKDVVVDNWTKLENGFSFTEPKKCTSSNKNGLSIATTSQVGDEIFHNRINSSSKLSLNLPALSSPQFATSPSHIRISKENKHKVKSKKKKHRDTTILNTIKLEKKLKKTQKRILCFDVLNSIFATILIILSYIEHETLIREIRNIDGSIQRTFVVDQTVTIIRIVTLGFSFCGIWFVYWRGSQSIKQNHLLTLIYEGGYHTKMDLQPPVECKNCMLQFLEAAFNILVTFPFMVGTFEGDMLNGSYEYSWSSIVTFFVPIRAYHYIRLYSHCKSCAVWKSPAAYQVYRERKFKPSCCFFLKYEMKKRPISITLLLFIISTLFFGAALRISEMTFVSDTSSGLDFSNFFNVIWVAAITMTTVGYGDGYPSTHYGRFISVMACCLAMALTSLLIVATSSAFSLNRREERCYYGVNRAYSQANFTENGGRIIKIALQLAKVKRERVKNIANHGIQLQSLLQKLEVRIKQHYSMKRDHNMNTMFPTDLLLNLIEKERSSSGHNKQSLDYLLNYFDEIKELQMRYREKTRRLQTLNESAKVILEKLQKFRKKEYWSP